MTAPATVEHFERLAPAYSRLRRTWPLALLQDEEERAVRALATIPANARVLDAGCGAGQTMAWLVARGVNPIGVDRARAMAIECRRNGFSVSVQDMQAPAFGPHFDWVLCIGSLEFTTDPLLALRGFAACLKPDGQLVLLFPRRNWLGAIYALYHRRHGVHIHRFTRAEMEHLLHRVGLHAHAWQQAPMALVCRAQHRNQ